MNSMARHYRTASTLGTPVGGNSQEDNANKTRPPWLIPAIVIAAAIAVAVAVFALGSAAAPNPQVSYAITCYEDSSGDTIRETETLFADAGSTVTVTAPDIAGYEYSRGKAGDNGSSDNSLLSFTLPDNSGDTVQVSLYYKEKSTGGNTDTNNSETTGQVSSSASSISDYILPYSDAHAYSQLELDFLNNQRLFLARNEIFARHGFVFDSDYLSSYFKEKSWYKPVSPYNYELSDIEKENADAIRGIEEERNSPYLDDDYVASLPSVVASSIGSTAKSESSIIDLDDADVYRDVNRFLSNFSEWPGFWDQQDYESNDIAEAQVVNWGFWHYALNNDDLVQETTEVPGTTNGFIESDTGIGEYGGPWYYRNTDAAGAERSIKRYLGLDIPLKGYRGGYYAEEDGRLHESLYRGNWTPTNYVTLADAAYDDEDGAVRVDFTLYQVPIATSGGLTTHVEDESWYAMKPDELLAKAAEDATWHDSGQYTGYALLDVNKGSDTPYTLRKYHVDRGE